MIASNQLKVPLVPFQESVLRAQDLMGNDFDGLLIPLEFEFEGKDLNVQVLSSITVEIVKRHEALRSCYFRDDSGNWTVSIATENSSEKIAQLQMITQASSRKDAEKLARVFFKQWSPQELLQGPVIRFGLIQILSENNSETSPIFLMLMLVHHVAFDASSHAIIVQDIYQIMSRAYQTIPLPTSYFTFMNEINSNNENYWKDKLQAANLDVSIPCNKQSIQNRRTAERLQLELPKNIVMRLYEYCNATSNSRFTVLMVAFQIWLHKLNGGGEQIFTVGTPISSRFIDKTKWSKCVGCFVDIVPIIAHIIPNQTFTEHVLYCKDVIKEIRNTPELISSRISNSGSKGLQAWFRTVVQWLDFTRFDVELNNNFKLTSRIRYDALTTVMFDLVTNFWFQKDNGIIIEALYCNQIISRELIACFFDSFVTLLDGLLTSPLLPISKVSLISLNQQTLINKTLHGPLDDCSFKSVAHAFQTVAAKYPNTVAVSDNNGISWTYSKLESLAEALQQKLIKYLNDSDNPLFAVHMDRSPELILALISIIRAGAGYVIIDPKLPSKRKEYILNVTQCRALLTTNKYVGVISAFTSYANTIFVNPQLYEEGQYQPISYPIDSAINYVAFTSGTTGTPKPAAISHRSVVLRFCGATKWTKIKSGDVQSCLSNISFDGFAFEWHSALLNGASLHILNDEEASSPSNFAQVCQETGITHAFLPTALFHAFVASQANCFAGLKFISVGGEALRKDSVESLFHELKKLPQYGLMNLYGPAEAGVACAIYTILDIERDCRRYCSIPIGFAMPNVTMNIVDSNGQDISPGVTGELLVGGPSITDGRYLGLPAINKEKWVETSQGRMYCTGDLVQLSPSGSLLYMGRIDNQIKVRSFRIDLGEIESTIAMYSGVKQVVVSNRDSSIVGFVVADSEIMPVDILSYLEMQLPQHFIPSNIVIVDRIPLTLNGKIDFNALPWPNVAPIKHKIQYESEIERKLAEIEEEVLGLSTIPREENYFSLGGDSISAIVIASKAKKIGINIRPLDIIKYPSLKILAKTINSSFNEAQTISRPNNKQLSMSITPTPIQKWCFNLGWKEINYFTQALLLELPSLTSITKVQQAFLDTIAAHPGISVSYSNVSNSFFYNNEVAFCVSQVTIKDFNSIQQLASSLTSSIDINHGPLIVASLINLLDEKQFVLFCASHLIVDAVSWYMFKNNFLEALNGTKLQPQPSWMDFSLQLTSNQIIDYFISSESAYWETVDFKKWDIAKSLPITSVTSNIENNNQSIRIISQSKKVITEDSSSMFEITLAALSLAVCEDELFNRGLLVCVETNGRQFDCPFIVEDFSESIGWFTSIYPLLIGGYGGNIKNLVESIKKQVKSVPHHGFGYGILKYNATGDIQQKLESLPEPQISFNFFGKASDTFSINFSPEFQNQEKGSSQLFVPARPTGKKPFLIEAICKQVGNVVELSLDYSSVMFNEVTIYQVIERFFMYLDRLCDAKNHVNTYPVTPMQEGMIYHSQSEPLSYVYRCQTVYSIVSDAPLDFEKLKNAWEAVINVYPVITNKFYWKSGMLWQEPRQNFKLPWRVTNSRNHFNQVLAQSLQDINVLEGKTFEVIVDNASKQMAVTFHHAILDGWSLALIINRLQDEYCKNISFTEKTSQFEDYIKWLNERKPQVMGDSEDFWRQELKEVQPVLLTPLLSPQPHESVVPISQGRLTERHYFSSDLKRAIMASAKKHCVSSYVIYHAAWLSVLSRFLSTPDIVVGITFSGRMYSEFPDIESLVGLLINTIPHRIVIEQDEETGSLIQRIHSQLQGLFEHSHVPLSILNTLSGLSRGEQLFDSIIVFENYPMPIQESELSFTLQYVKEQTNFPLSLCIDGSGVSLHYNGEKIGGCSARLLLRCFVKALEQISSLHHTNFHVRDIMLLNEKERECIIHKYEENLQKKEDITLCSLVMEHAILSPNSIAILDSGKSVTYSQMIDLAKSVASSLSCEFAKQGCSRFVAIVMKRSHWLISSMLGVHMAGGAFVLIDDNFPQSRITDMLTETQSCVVISLSNIPATLLKSTNLPVIFVDKIPEVTTTVPSINTLETSHVVYTSGSSGKPKGVIITHKNMFSRLASKTDNLEPAWLTIGPSDVVANVCSPSFDVYFSEVFHGLIHGACIAIIPERTVLSPRDTAIEFSKMGVTHVFMPTALFHALAAITPEIFMSLKHIHVGGEVLQIPLLRKIISACGNRLPPLGFVNGYGPTEATIGSHRYIIRDVKQIETLSSIPIGHLCPNTIQYIVDSTGNLAPIGMIGELLLGGECISPGYLGSVELTNNKFTDDCFSQNCRASSKLYHTGDLVRWTENGDIEFWGRKDLQVKVRGYRIELEEVEKALLSIDGITAASVVVSINNSLIAFLVPHAAIILDYNELIGQLQKLLPQYMIPTKFAVVSAIPTTTGGKIDRASLLKMESSASFLKSIDSDNSELNNKYADSPLLITLSNIWKDVLKLNDMRIDENFFELGGDSILAMRAARYAEEQGIDISVHDIFDYPKLSDLIEKLATNNKFDIKDSYKEQVVTQVSPTIRRNEELAAGMISLAIAIPDKKFRPDKLTKLIDFLNLCSFPTEYIQHIRETERCPGVLLGNDWYINQPWYPKWLETVPKIKNDPFDGLETRARFPLDPKSLRETCQPFPMLCSDASVLAGAAALVYADVDPLEIDGLIDCAMPQDDGSDTNYLKVHEKLGLKNATPLSLFTACTSFISAVEVAAAYVRAGHRKRVLVCATQIGSHISDPTSSVGCKLADGAVAAIISQVQPNEGYQGSHGSALGEFCGAMDLSLKPPLMHLESPKSLNLCSYLHPGDMMLYDNTFAASVKEMVAICKAALQKSEITDYSQIFFAPHQPNSELPLLWARELGIKRMKFTWNIYGSMGPVCPAVNLFLAIEQELLRAGEIALLAAPGISMNYYALVERVSNELVKTITGK